jgi:hypothetical protein
MYIHVSMENDVRHWDKDGWPAVEELDAAEGEEDDVVIGATTGSASSHSSSPP